MDACWKPGKSQRKLMRKIAQRRTLGVSMASEWLSSSERRRRQRRLRRARKARSGWTAAGGLVPPADSECGEPGSSYTNPGPATPPPAPRREVGTGGESGAAGMGREAGSAGRRCGVEGGGGLGWWRGAAPPRDACELRTGSAPRGPERRRPRAGEPSPQTAPGGGLARAGTPTLRCLRCGLTVSPRQLPELS